MRWLRWLIPGASLLVVACGTIDRTALDNVTPDDAGTNATSDVGVVGSADLGSPAGGADAGTPATVPDAGSPGGSDAGSAMATDVGAPVTPPPADAGTPAVDAGTPAVDAGRPAVDAGVATDTGCRACVAFAPVAFCPGTGPGYCLAYQGCTSASCAVCAMPTAGGDDCGSVVVLSATGRQRSVVSTCGARNNVDTACGSSGPDIVVGVRVARRGRVAVRMTVPAGVTVNFGYDLVGASSCASNRVGRQCVSRTAAVTQSFELTLDAGTYHLYAVTSQPTTVVVETELP